MELSVPSLASAFKFGYLQSPGPPKVVVCKNFTFTVIARS